jgi:hypothetical protein
MTEEDLHLMLDDGSEAGIIEHRHIRWSATCAGSMTGKSPRSWFRAARPVEFMR